MPPIAKAFAGHLPAAVYPAFTVTRARFGHLPPSLSDAVVLDVTLHFGAHRTASTTFQRMLGQSAAALAGAGIAYWGPKRTRSDLFSGLMGPPRLSPFAMRQGARAAGRISLALSEIADTGARHLLVSEENLIGSLRRSLLRQVLYGDASGRAVRLAGAFGSNCRQIAFAIRSYDAWWASALAFSVARGGPVPSDQVAAALAAQPRRWRHVIAELGAAFPEARIVVWSHEAMSARPDEVAHALLGTGALRLSGTRDWHNAAPTIAALRSHLIDLGADPGGLRETAGRFMPFSSAERRKLQTDYAEDIAWLQSGQDPRITYIDDLGTNPVATGTGRGSSHDAEAIGYRRLA